MFKFLKSSYFPNRMMNLFHIWYDDRYNGPKFLSAIPQPMPIILRSMLQTLKFYKLSITLKFLKSSYFPNEMMDVIQILHDNRQRSKVLFSNTLSMPMHLR